MMDEDKAREILGGAIKPDGGLFEGVPFIDWDPGYLDQKVTLDGHFIAEELEAIAWWMRKHGSSASQS